MHAHTIGSRIDTVIDGLWQAGGTDLLLTAGLPPQIRVQGRLQSMPGAALLSPADTEALLAELLTPVQAARWDAEHELDFSVGWRDKARIRGNAFIQRGATTVTLRIVARAIPTMRQLGVPAVLGSFVQLNQGLVIVTGPRGSGKSTTLASMIDAINTHRACHIITVEDPIEYLFDHKRSAVNQREVASDTASLGDALRSALREDPDVLLVAEIRDAESARIALTVAETGHLVLAGLNATDTTQSVARLIDLFPPEQHGLARARMSAALTGIVGQRLLPRVGGGLIAAFEVLVADTAIRNLIKDGKTNQLRNTMMTSRSQGMATFEQSLTALVQSGQVRYDEAVLYSLYPQDIVPNFSQPWSGAGAR